MASPWLEAAITLAIIAAIPFAAMAATRSARGRGNLGGAALMIGLAFGALFDPAAARSAEIIRKHNETDEGEAAGAPPEP